MVTVLPGAAPASPPLPHYPATHHLRPRLPRPAARLWRFASGRRGGPLEVGRAGPGARYAATPSPSVRIEKEGQKKEGPKDKGQRFKVKGKVK